MYIYTKLYTFFLVIIKSCFGFITTTANTFIILLYTVSNTADKFRKMAFFISTGIRRIKLQPSLAPVLRTIIGWGSGSYSKREWKASLSSAGEGQGMYVCVSSQASWNFSINSLFCSVSVHMHRCENIWRKNLVACVKCTGDCYSEQHVYPSHWIARPGFLTAFDPLLLS